MISIPPTTKEMAEEFTTASDSHAPDLIVGQTFLPDGPTQRIHEMKGKALHQGEKDNDKTPKKGKGRLPTGKGPPRPFNYKSVS
jgi:hypothetical protein